MAGNAFGHTAVVVNADNADGVLNQLCTSIALKMEPLDEEAREVVSTACFQWAIEEMYPKDYEHNHG